MSEIVLMGVWGWRSWQGYYSKVEQRKRVTLVEEESLERKEGHQQK